ncbi:MAG: lipopolysaccharide biosynthesis protein [Caulobacterales bacterium]|nr:lipopolysaccharide biosynthesis protein [Caulobacterales bacterium]
MAEAALGGGVVRRIYGNLGRLLGGKLAAGLLSLAYMAVAARALGPADYGVLILVHTYIMTVGGIIEFPGWHAVVRYGAQAMEADDRPRITRLLVFAGVVEAAGGLCAVLVAAALAPVLGPRLGWSQTAIDFALPYSLAVLASIRATPAGYLQLTRRFGLLGAHSAVAPTVRLAGAAVVVLTHTGLRGFLIAWLVAALAEWLAMWAFGAWAARGKLARPRFQGGLKHVLRENPGIWSFMLGANADVTVSELAGRLAPLAVGWVLGPASAAFYAVGQRATSVLAQPAQILGQAAYAELARLAAAGDRGPAIRSAVQRAVLIALAAASPIVLGVALFGERVSVLMAGAAFAGAAPVMLWLTVARALQLAGPPISAALTALGRPGLSVTANLTSGLGLMVILPWMLHWRGLDGAGLHALIQSVVGIVLLVIFAWRETTVRPGAHEARA